MRGALRLAVPAAALLAAAGCGGGSAGTSSGARSTAASARQQIERDWTAFFSSSTPVARKVTLLQDGKRFEKLIQAASTSPLAASVKASVEKVTLQSPTRARVVYSILAGGKPVLAHRTGEAVLVGGVWQVGKESFCALLALEGSHPPGC